MSKGKDWRGLTKNVEVRIWWWRWYGFYYVGTDTCILRCACTNIFILSPAAPSRRLFLCFRPSIKADYDISTYITYMHFRYVWSNADKRQPVITTINELSEKTSTVRTVVYQDIEVNLFQQDLFSSCCSSIIYKGGNQPKGCKDWHVPICILLNT